MVVALRAAGEAFLDGLRPADEAAHRSACDAPSERSPTRWAIATCCATRPPGVSRAGWHRIDARLRGVKGEVHVRRGYWIAGVGG